MNWQKLVLRYLSRQLRENPEGLGIERISFHRIPLQLLNKIRSSQYKDNELDDQSNLGLHQIKKKYKRRLQRRNRQNLLLVFLCLALVITSYLLRPPAISEATMKFNYLTLREVAMQLEQKYPIRIYILNEEASDCKLSATFYRADSSLGIVSAIARFMNMRLEIIDNQYILSGGSSCNSI